MLPATTDVLVVGAGPVGLATALTLTAQGADVTVVDRLAERVETSRAAVVHARTLEVLDSVGVAGPLVEQGIPVARVTVRDGDRILTPIRFDNLPTRFPYALMVPQSTTEAVLLDRLCAAGGRVLRPYAVTGLDRDDAEAVVTFGGGEKIRARYVVGADGMHSTVREAAGIRFVGGDSVESFALADLHVRGELPRDEVILFFSRTGLMVWLPLPGGVVRIIATVDDAPERPDVAYAQRLLDTRGPAGPRSTVEEVVWGSRFRVHYRIAETFRRGPVLLAGDAAHVHSPAGGQGMNLGLIDGVTLGNALSHALAGGGDALLDDYVAARRPVAESVVRFTNRLTRVLTAGPALRVGRNAALRLLTAAPAFRHRVAMRLSGLVYR